MSGFSSIRGTVTLVALCFVAVIGITLAGYIAVGSRTMNLSNRSFQGNLSMQLAEMGIEEALRAFNKNDWSDWTSTNMNVDWTLDSTNKRATATISFPANKFGQGVTGSVKIRVDNYDAHVLGSEWSGTRTYRIGDLAGNNGLWFRSLRDNNTNKQPYLSDLTWWVRNPVPWKWRSNNSYSQYEMVNHKGVWYRCHSGHTSHASGFSNDASRWTAIPSQRAWSSGVTYAQHNVVNYTDPTTGDVTVYRCLTDHTSTSFSSDSANWDSNVKTVSLAWSSGQVYNRGALLFYAGSGIHRWYYAMRSGTSSIAPDLDTSRWAPIWNDLTGSAVNPASDTLVSGTNYLVGDNVFYDNTWQRCTTAHLYTGTWVGSNWDDNVYPRLQIFYGVNSTDSNAIYTRETTWYRHMGSANPALTGPMHGWTSGLKYYMGDVVYYSATSQWYRCLRAHTASSTLNPTDSTYWATTPLLTTTWEANRQYSQNDTVRHQGVWYLSLQNSNIGKNPATASSAYWAVAPQSLSAWEATKNYNLDALVSYSGIWYRCILPHTTNQVPTNPTYWAVTTGSAYAWDPATACSAGVYRSYGGVWYKCTTSNTGQSPNNTTYWTAAWTQSTGVITGAPVVYVEGTIAIAGNPTVKTQLRTPIAPAPLFPHAITATDTISATGGGLVDSYDSTTGTVALTNGTVVPSSPTNNNYSTYASHVNAATNFSATLAAGATSGTAVSLSSPDVRGYVAANSASTSPYAPLFSSGGSLKGFSSPATPTRDLSRVSRSPSIPRFDTLPGGAGGLAANWATTPKGTPLSLTSTINLGTPGDLVPSRYHYNGDLTINSGKELRINGPVILYINGNLLVDDTDSSILIASTGSAEIHVAGTIRIEADSAGITNLTSDPKSLIFISDNTGANSQYYRDSGADLYGVFYMPYSTSTSGYHVSKDGFNDPEIFGAVFANRVTYSTNSVNMYVHYDTSLRHATFGGVDQPYTVTEWRELDATEQATMP